MATGKSLKTIVVPCLACVWAIGVILGMFGMVRYQMTPAADASDTTAHWPRAVSIKHTPAFPRLS